MLVVPSAPAVNRVRTERRLHFGGLMTTQPSRASTPQAPAGWA